MIFNLGNIMQDPLAYLLSLLLLLPGAMLAISIHESAHGWVAEKCGDPTARYAGRITLNPIKHFDPIGFFCLLFLHFGWAKPVPVNPLLFKNYRKDDLKVSLAGITANLCLFLVCFIILTTVFAVGVSNIPVYETKNLQLKKTTASGGEYEFECMIVKTNGELESCFVTTIDGKQKIVSPGNGGEWEYVSKTDFEQCFQLSTGVPASKLIADSIDNYLIIKRFSDPITVTRENGRQRVWSEYYTEEYLQEQFRNQYYFLGTEAAQLILGKVIGILYVMVIYCMLINLSLAVFNLIPLPPLDGYHVLNDLVLHQDLFAQRRTQQITGMILVALILIGHINPQWSIIGKGINFVLEGITGGLGALVRALGVI